jgi:CelD/BcsL family acetyltransferase involved in cellulose biosynthesis
MQVTAYTDASAFDVLQSEWNDLVRCSQADMIFSTWEWHSHWWQAYHPGDLWILAVRDNEKLLGIASFFVEQHPEHGSLCRIVGSVDVTDYMDLIIHRDHLQVVYQTFSDYLFQHNTHFDVLDLCNIPQDSPTYTHFVDVLQSTGFAVTTEQQETCPTIVLPDTFDAYIESLESKQRSELRRKLRRAEGSDAMAWYIVGAEHDLQTELDRFLGLMQASHPAKARFLENPQHVAFFSSFMPIAFANGWLQLNFETVDDEAVASYLNFVYHNDILVYNSGLEPNKFGNMSPGIVLLANNIQHAITQKKRHFNFLRGNETYKYQMGGKDSPIFNIKASIPTSK